MLIYDVVKENLFEYFDACTSEEILFFLMMKGMRSKVRKEKIKELEKQASIDSEFEALLSACVYFDNALSTVKYSVIEKMIDEYIELKE